MLLLSLAGQRYACSQLCTYYQACRDAKSTSNTWQLYTTNEATYFVPGDPLTRGRAFQMESERLLALEGSSPSLPVAQAVVLMCGYEGVSGSIIKAMDYLHRYVEIYKQLRLSERLHLHMRSQHTPGSRGMRISYAISWIDWGFYILEWWFHLVLFYIKLANLCTGSL